MILLIMIAVCAVCAVGYWWLGRTATPGQKALEERMKANRGAFRRSLGVPGIFGRLAPSRKVVDSEWWVREPERPEVPEPDEHKEPWRR